MAHQPQSSRSSSSATDTGIFPRPPAVPQSYYQRAQVEIQLAGQHDILDLHGVGRDRTRARSASAPKAPHPIRDSFQSVPHTTTSSSVYPPSTTSSSDTPSSPISLKTPTSMNTALALVESTDDVAFRLQLLMKNNYWLPPAHAKPILEPIVQISPASEEDKTPKKRLLRKSKKASLPEVRTTRPSSPPAKHAFPPPMLPFNTRPRTAESPLPSPRVVVLREPLPDIMAAAKESEKRETEKRRQLPQPPQTPIEAPNGYFDLDPTTTFDVPSSNGSPPGVPSSNGHAMGTQPSNLSASGMASQLVPTEDLNSLFSTENGNPHPHPGVDEREMGWRRMLLQEAVGLSMTSSSSPFSQSYNGTPARTPPRRSEDTGLITSTPTRPPIPRRKRAQTNPSLPAHLHIPVIPNGSGSPSPYPHSPHTQNQTTSDGYTNTSGTSYHTAHSQQPPPVPFPSAVPLPISAGPTHVNFMPEPYRPMPPHPIVIPPTPRTKRRLGQGDYDNSPTGRERSATLTPNPSPIPDEDEGPVIGPPRTHSLRHIFSTPTLRPHPDMDMDMDVSDLEREPQREREREREAVVEIEIIPEKRDSIGPFTALSAPPRRQKSKGETLPLAKFGRGLVIHDDEDVDKANDDAETQTQHTERNRDADASGEEGDIEPDIEIRESLSQSTASVYSSEGEGDGAISPPLLSPYNNSFSPHSSVSMADDNTSFAPSTSTTRARQQNRQSVETYAFGSAGGGGDGTRSPRSSFLSPEPGFTGRLSGEYRYGRGSLGERSTSTLSPPPPPASNRYPSLLQLSATHLHSDLREQPESPMAFFDAVEAGFPVPEPVYEDDEREDRDDIEYGDGGPGNDSATISEADTEDIEAAVRGGSGLGTLAVVNIAAGMERFGLSTTDVSTIAGTEGRRTVEDDTTTTMVDHAPVREFEVFPPPGAPSLPPTPGWNPPKASFSSDSHAHTHSHSRAPSSEQSHYSHASYMTYPPPTAYDTLDRTRPLTNSPHGVIIAPRSPRRSFFKKHLGKGALMQPTAPSSFVPNTALIKVKGKGKGKEEVIPTSTFEALKYSSSPTPYPFPVMQPTTKHPNLSTSNVSLITASADGRLERKELIENWQGAGGPGAGDGTRLAGSDWKLEGKVHLHLEAEKERMRKISLQNRSRLK